jgi:hypothetical protein
MNIRTWKITCFLALLTSLASPFHLKAQNLPIIQTSGTAVDFEWRLDGSIVEKGSSTTVLSSSDTAELQSSSRFLWYPAVSALRAGGGWFADSASNVGQYSVAFGLAAMATAPESMAFGSSVAALGPGAVAFGCGSTALGSYSTVMGSTNQAYGTNSTATGSQTCAHGAQSLTMGNYTSAYGAQAVAMGMSTIASGTNSTAMGSAAYATSYDSVAMGAYNVGLSQSQTPPSGSSWVGVDPLLELGNGTGFSNPSDALVVYKNGNAILSGTLTVAPGGDIPMFTGQN